MLSLIKLISIELLGILVMSVIPLLQSDTVVMLHVMDVNDNAPIFSSPLYTGTVEEDDFQPRNQSIHMASIRLLN